MAIQLVYKYHVIDKMANKNTNNTDVKGTKMFQCFIADEFLVVCLYTVTKGRPTQVGKSLFLKDWMHTYACLKVRM